MFNVRPYYEPHIAVEVFVEPSPLHVNHQPLCTSSLVCTHETVKIPVEKVDFKIL